MAVALGDRLIAVDLFDAPASCHKVWDRMLSGVMLDALECRQTAATVAVDSVESLLNQSRALPWTPCKAVGDGDEYRAREGQGLEGSALSYAGRLLHGSLVTG